MRNLVIFLALIASTSCASLPLVIPDAPYLHAKAVVFDIDGTLTPTPLKYWKARDDAASAVQLFSEEGYEIIYLTARVTPLQKNIPVWLKEHGFPDGNVFVTQTAEDRRDHARFKTRILRDVVAHGWTIGYAYGDSSTDFEAYAAVDIPRQHVFALRREGDKNCQPGAWNACLSGWTEYLDSRAK